MSRAADEELTGRILTQLGAQPGQAVGIRRLVRVLCLPAHANRRVRRLLKELVREGRVVAEGRGRYSLASRQAQIEGALGRPVRGFFPLVDDRSSDVLLRIPAQDCGGGLPGDLVLAEPTRRRSRGPDEGRVVGLLRRGEKPIVGVYRRQAKASYAVPDEADLSGPVLVTGGLRARDGQVVAVVVDDPRPLARPHGRIVAVLGEPGELGTERERLLLEHDLRRSFPAQVEQELAASAVDSAADGRADLRAVPQVTIDPPDAKDFDDAVWVERIAGGYRLWVSIADVAAFVPLGSAIDAEAVRRGCSTYLPGTVFPMLPPELSERLCSLGPGRDRAAVTLEIELDDSAAVVAGRVRRSLIRSAARLSYDEVQRLLDGRDSSAKARRFADGLRLMDECASRLLERMERRGQLVFDLPDSDIQLDEAGFVQRVRPAFHGVANRIIEAFMVAANEAVAGLLTAAKAPLIYRIHPPPEAGRIAQFVEIAESLGAPAHFGREPSSRALAAYLRSLRGRSVAPALEQLLLRSLAQARYAAECSLHFGLASPCYLHFTSPIRRYPDLAVQRQLGHLLDAAGPDGVRFGPRACRVEDWPLDASRVTELAESCSRAERRALAAERSAQQLYHAAYMSRRIGEVYSGRVSFAADFGLFVRVEPSGVEGLVHLSSMGNDFYQYDERQLALIGKRSGQRFRIGQRLQVRVASAQLGQRQVDLKIV